MPPSPNTNDAAGESGRVRCLYCGANNFPASAACWQCGRPLKAAGAAMPEVANSPMPGPLPGIVAAQHPLAARYAVESSLAPKAAAAMGLIFPWIGLPVGIVFLMLDDPRKTQIGWMAIAWSVLGTVLNIVAGIILSAMLSPLLKGLTPHAPGVPAMPDLGGDGASFLLPLRLLAPLFASLLFPVGV